MDTLSPSEKALFRKLSNPLKIQDFLDTLPINFERRGDTHHSPRSVLQYHTAHCIEGALLAAAILAFHGERPLLMDFTTKAYDEDHVVALFTKNGYWGALSKTNHAFLRYRDPVYESPRELALSYYHEYFMFADGKKTLVSYSDPVDMTLHGTEWITTDKDLFWVDALLDGAPHHALVPPQNRRTIRPVDAFTRRTLKNTEW